MERINLYDMHTDFCLSNRAINFAFLVSVKFSKQSYASCTQFKLDLIRDKTNNIVGYQAYNIQSSFKM